MKVQDVMHKGAICVEPGTPVREIARSMRDSDIGAIPVRAAGQLVGIVTDRDIACRAIGDSADIAQMTARDIMTKNVVCCSADDEVEAAIQTMESKQIRRLPVLDAQNSLIGMFSLGDISHKVGLDLSGEVLRAVSEHHA